MFVRPLNLARVFFSPRQFPFLQTVTNTSLLFILTFSALSNALHIIPCLYQQSLNLNILIFLGLKLKGL